MRGDGMVEKGLKLVVAENRHQAYVNRGFALIDEGVMKRFGIKQGDIVEITGPRSTVRLRSMVSRMTVGSR